MGWRRLSLQAIGAFLLVALFGASASAQCFSTDEVEVESAHRYLHAFIESLSDARDANAEIDDKSAIELMVGMRRRIASYRCAESRVTKYQSSTNKAIETSALAATQAYSILGDLEEQALKHLSKSIDQVSAGTFKPGTAAEISSGIAAKQEEAGSFLLQAAVAASYAAVAADPATKLMSRLSVTSTQRDELVSRLRKLFGDSIIKGVQPGQSRLQGAGALLYQVLSDPKRRPQ
jgi:hypothetical protein